MKYSNRVVKDERIYRKIFELKMNKKTGKWKQYDGKKITVTCACAQVNDKRFYGFSIQSPKEEYVEDLVKPVDRRRSLSPARGRLRKAIILDNGSMEYPQQKWITRDQLTSFVDEINKKRKNW
jgi:hypothetical protein